MFTFILLILTSVLTLQADDPLDTYIYWYDQTATMWRIEATDGSAQYGIAAWDTPDSGRTIRYAEWSPSGKWLAWQTVASESSAPVVNVVSLSGEPISVPDWQQNEITFVQWLGINDWLMLIVHDANDEAFDPQERVIIYDVNRRTTVLEFSWQTARLVEEILTVLRSNTCSELACQRPLPERVIRQIQSRMIVDATCRVELNRRSSHSTVLIYVYPELDALNPLGALSSTCYGICDSGLPAVGYLPTDNVPIYWYQVDYHGRVGWVNLQDDVRLAGRCDALPAILVSGFP